MRQQDIRLGQAVLYVKGEKHIELGIVKSFNAKGDPFVLYHTGSTAACTPPHMLQPLYNEYAFQIIKKDANEEYQTQHARQIACNIIENIESQFLDDIIKLDSTPINEDDGDARIRGIVYHNLEHSITELIENTKRNEE